ncbi:hypothetical protein Fcan01_07805 [Folsomia candida]|uniref:Uncharacterized protein n=1 Tax=Folsomia candida TaxID=158441 RepID=A0A226EMM5_FOLCA|nr:hypothetical protein Fcan01_07805 [Folsomia candida]
MESWKEAKVFCVSLHWTRTGRKSRGWKTPFNSYFLPSYSTGDYTEGENDDAGESGVQAQLCSPRDLPLHNNLLGDSELLWMDTHFAIAYLTPSASFGYYVSECTLRAIEEAHLQRKLTGARPTNQRCATNSTSL